VLIIRIIVLATAAALGVSVTLWLYTGERKWLLLAWRIFKVALYAIVVVLLLFAGERLLEQF
jgi:hypothetical protein